MFESNPSVRSMKKETRQGLLIWGLLVVLLLPGGWLVWRAWNQRQARAWLDTVQEKLEEYHARYDGYPDSLERLRGLEHASDRDPQPESSQLLHTREARDRLVRNGYEFHYVAGGEPFRWAASVPLRLGYRIVASPVSSWTGRWHYAVNDREEFFEELDRAELHKKIDLMDKAAAPKDEPEVKVVPEPVEPVP